MRYLSILFLATILLCSCWNTTPPDGSESDSGNTKKYFYKNGNLKSEVTHKEGKLDGPTKTYYEDGGLNIEVNYVDGKKAGIEKKYYGTGELYRERPYELGAINGWERRYYKSGQLMSEILYKYGMPGKELNEYKHGGAPITKYPELVFSIERNRDHDGQTILTFNLSDGSKNVKYYKGELIEGIFYDKNASLLPCRDGVGEIVLGNPQPGQTISIVGMKITRQHTPYIFQKTFTYK